MTFQDAEQLAKSGYTLLLPGWVGYFTWNYSSNEINFKNGDYKLTYKQLKDKNIFNRNDWYYII